MNFMIALIFSIAVTTHMVCASSYHLSEQVLNKREVYYRVTQALHAGSTVTTNAMLPTGQNASSVLVDHNDNLISRWAGALLLDLVWTGNLKQTSSSKRKALISVMDKLNNPDTRAILAYLVGWSSSHNKAIQDDIEKRLHSLTKTERDVLTAALIMGDPQMAAQEKEKQKNWPVVSGIFSKDTVTPTNAAGQTVLWWNQSCADIADRGRTITFTGTHQHKQSLMRALAWLVCGRFIVDQGHSQACQKITDGNGVGIPCTAAQSISFALPQSKSPQMVKYIWS